MDEATPRPPKRRLRRILSGLVILALLFVLTLFVVVQSLLYSESFAAWVLETALPVVNEKVLPGEVRFASFEGSLGESIRLNEVQVFDERGEVAVRAEALTLEWDAVDLLARRVDVQRLHLEEPVVFVRIREDRTVNFKEAFVKPRTKPKKKREGPVELPFTLDVRDIQIDRGHVEVILGDREPTVLVEDFAVRGVWSMRNLDQDFSFSKIEAHLRRPVDPGPVSAHGSGTLKKVDLTLDAFTVDWGDDQVVVSGAWPRVGRGVADLHVAVERLDLEHLKVFSEKIPLAGVVSGPLEVDGALSDVHVKGALDVDGGGRLDLADVGARIARGEPLGHSLDVTAEAFPLREVITIDALPPELTGRITWDGEGTRLPTLEGDVTADLQGFVYQSFHVEPTTLRASIADSKVAVDHLETGADGALLTTSGDVDLEEGSFVLDTVANVPDLSGLGYALKLPMEGGSVRLNGRQEGSWKSPGAAFVLDTDSTISGTVVAVGGLLFDGIDGDWTLEVALGRDGRPPSVHGTVGFVAREMKLGDLEIAEVSVEATGSDTAAIYELVATEGDARAVRTNGRVAWGDLPTLRVDVDGLQLDWDGEQVTGSGMRVTTRSGRVETTPGRFDLHPGTLEAGGVWDPRGELDLKVAVTGVDLRRLGPWLPETLRLGGSVSSMTVGLTGTREEPTVAVALRATGLQATGRGPMDADLDLDWAPAGIQGALKAPGLFALTLGHVPLSLRLAGKRPLVLAPEGRWDVEFAGEHVPLDEWASRLALELPEAADGGSIRGRLRIGGTTSNLTMDGDFDVTELKLAERGVHLSAGLVLADDHLSLRDTHLRDASAGTVFSLAAEVDTALGDHLLSRLGPTSFEPAPIFSDLAIEGGFRRLPLEILHALVPAMEPLQGALRGRVALEGQLADPKLDVDLALLGGTLGDRVLKTAKLKLGVGGGALDGTLEVAPDTGGRLVVTPRAKVFPALDGSRTLEEMFGVPDSLRASVKGDGFPVEVLLAFVPGILEAEGAVVLGGAVTGSLLRPQPRVSLKLDPARVCYTRTSICYEDIHLHADLDPARLEVTSFDFATLPIIRNPLDAAFRQVDAARAGGLKGRGRIALDGWRLGNMDIELRGKKTWLIYTQEIQTLVDAALDIQGVYPELSIAGNVDILDLNVDMGSADVQRSVQPMVLPESVRVHRTDSKRGPGEREIARQIQLADTERPPTFLEQIDVDVAVDLGVNNRVRLAYGVGEALAKGADDNAGKTLARGIDLIGKIEPDVRPEGAVRVLLRDGVPRLAGRVGVQTNSKLKVLTAKFDLDTESDVEFGGEIADSALDLRAVHTSRYGEIAVVVGGAISNPEISFESDAFDSQADMLAVLLTGRPLSDHSAAEGNATTRAVSGALSGFTTKLLDKVVPLDIFQLDLGDDVSSGAVEAGKAIGSRVVVITRFTWGGEDDENRVEAEVEVLLTRGLYFRARGGDRAEGSVDVVYKQRF